MHTYIYTYIYIERDIRFRSICCFILRYAASPLFDKNYFTEIYIQLWTRIYIYIYIYKYIYIFNLLLYPQVRGLASLRQELLHRDLHPAMDAHIYIYIYLFIYSYIYTYIYIYSICCFILRYAASPLFDKNYFTEIYIQPWTRAQPFLVGVGFAIFWDKIQQGGARAKIHEGGSIREGGNGATTPEGGRGVIPEGERGTARGANTDGGPAHHHETLANTGGGEYTNANAGGGPASAGGGPVADGVGNDFGAQSDGFRVSLRHKASLLLVQV